MTTEKRIQKFRFELLRKDPFYGDVVMRLEFREDRTIPTAAAGGLTVLYNPAFLLTLSDGEMNFVMMHEIMHILLEHSRRAGNRDPRLWNVAVDYIVNAYLLRTIMPAMKKSAIPFERPKEGLFTSLAYNEDAENLYAKIVSDNAQLMKDGKLKGNRITVRRSYAQDVIMRGNATEITVPPAGCGLPGGDLMADSLSPAQAAAMQDQLREIVRGALNSAGRSPFGSFPVPQEAYRLTQTKKLNWRSLLRNMLSEVRSDETSWTTPERKYLHMDLILPGHGESEETLEEAWAFVDCSGSVGHDLTEQFLTQLYRLLKEFRCTMHLVYWDTAVHEVYRGIRSEKELLASVPRHSGGTDINCVYRWIRENRVKPDAMLILTDGWFGTLTEENGRLRRNTIVVLSPNSAPVNDNIRKVGRPASL